VGAHHAEAELHVSAHAATAPKTRTAEPRPPAGFPFGFYRYRNYVVFAATSVFMALGCVGLIEALYALAHGEEAWKAFLANMARPHNLVLSVVVLLFTLYFVFRFAWVGRKIAAGRIGPVPRPPLPMPILGVAPIGGFVTFWLILLAILAGVLP
jgi:divalent metal cation (Fe/Co/Zn/Cd) transporter